MKFKKLAVITDCIHFDAGDGKIGTLNHVLMRQLQALALYFEAVVICCPFVAKPQQSSFSTYDDKSISFLRSVKVGGDSLIAKWEIIKTIPSWLLLYKQINLFADIVYMRFPNNISIPAFFYFLIKRKKAFATFTAAWDYNQHSSTSTNFQKKMLQYFFKKPVWVYSNSKQLPENIYHSFSPSYSKDTWADLQLQVKEKIQCTLLNGFKMLRIIAVGTLDKNKNQIYLLDTALLLKTNNIPFNLTLVGTGILFPVLKDYIIKNNLENEVVLTGFQSKEQLEKRYLEHDFIAQSSLVEGYGKIIIEGFFHGLIPLISNTSLMAEEFTGKEKGFKFNVHDKLALYEILKTIYYHTSKQKLADVIGNGNNYAANLTIENWAKEYIDTLNEFYN